MFYRKPMMIYALLLHLPLLTIEEGVGTLEGIYAPQVRKPNKFRSWEVCSVNPQMCIYPSTPCVLAFVWRCAYNNVTHHRCPLSPFFHADGLLKSNSSKGKADDHYAQPIGLRTYMLQGAWMPSVITRSNLHLCRNSLRLLRHINGQTSWTLDDITPRNISDKSTVGKL